MQGQFTDNLHPIMQQTVLGVLSSHVRAFATRRSQMTPAEIEALIIYKKAASKNSETSRKNQNISASNNQSQKSTPKSQPFTFENTDEVDEEMRIMDSKPEAS